MSKSLGNIEDPMSLAKTFGVDQEQAWIAAEESSLIISSIMFLEL